MGDFAQDVCLSVPC